MNKQERKRFKDIQARAEHNGCCYQEDEDDFKFLISLIDRYEKEFIEKSKVLESVEIDTGAIAEANFKWLSSKTNLPWEEWINLPENKSKILRLKEPVNPYAQSQYSGMDAVAQIAAQKPVEDPIITFRAVPKVEEYCGWKYNNNKDLFETACGGEFSPFDHAGYCPCCHKKIKVVE